MDRSGGHQNSFSLSTIGKLDGQPEWDPLVYCT